MNSILRNILGKIWCFSRHRHHQQGDQSITRRVCAHAAQWVLTVTVATLVLGAARPYQNRLQIGPPGQENPPTDTQPMNPLKPKQKQAILKSNFEKMKRDADDLNALAKSLQEDIDKSNENVFSLKVVEKAEKIEKLAKKIKDVAKGT